MSKEADRSPLAERGKALEDKYFHDKDQELIRAMQEEEEKKRSGAEKPEEKGDK